MHQSDEIFEEENPIFTLTDRDGQELSFLLNATLEFQGKLYAVMYPYHPENQEITDEKLFFVLDEDDTLSVVNQQELLDELERGGNAYRQAGGYNQGMSMGRYCASLCFANLMCNLCCRMGCCC